MTPRRRFSAAAAPAPFAAGACARRHAQRIAVVLSLLVSALGAPGARAGDEAEGRWDGLFPGRPTPGFDDYWYVNGKGGIVVTDQEFDNDGTLYGLTFGRTWGSQYAFEIEVAADELDFGIDYGLKHRSIGINHLTINREPLWDPYFLIGVGLLEFDGPEGLEERSDRDIMFNLGVGGEWELVIPRKVLLRADLRLRYGLNDNNQPGQNEFGDGIFTLGLTVPFGQGEQR